MDCGLCWSGIFAYTSRQEQTEMRKQIPTRFDEKQMELDRIKGDYLRYLGRVNRLRLRYRDWFDRQFQTFLNAVKTVQMTYPFMIPPQINCMSHFLKTYEFARTIGRNGTGISISVERMRQFLEFWTAFCELKKQGEDLNGRMCAFCKSITRLREPKLREEIDALQARLDQTSLDTFDFTELHNERENLFVYRTAGHDDKLQPLVGYLPYLLKLTASVCYFSTKLYIEKE